MMLTRVNEARAPRPGLAPDMWTAAGGSTWDLVNTVGWDSQPVALYFWKPTAGGQRLSQTLPGLRPGDRYSWFVTIAPTGAAAAAGVQVSIMGGPAVTLSAFQWYYLTGTFTATGADVFTVDTVGTWAASAWLFVDTLLVEDRHVGTSGRYFDGALPSASWAGIPWRTRSSLAYDADPVTLEPLSGTPMVTLEVDARPPQSWEFALDRSSLDGPDVLADTPRWALLRTVKQIGIRRGRDDDNAQVQAGTLQLALDNFDGLLDPDNPASPYRPNPSQTYLQRGALVRVSSLGIANALQFTVSSLFTGRLEDWQPGAAWDLSVTASAVDDLAALGTTDVPDFEGDGIRGGDTTGSRVTWACSQSGVAWKVSAGATRVLLPLAGGGSMRSVVDQAAAAEAGRLFADATNTVQLTVHADEYTKTPAVTITDEVTAATQVAVDYEDIATSSGIGEVVNQANVDRDRTVPDGQAQTLMAADLASIAVSGVQSITVVAPLADAVIAQYLATYLANRRSQRATRIKGLRVAVGGQRPVWAQRLVRMDLGTHVVVSRRLPYLSGPRQLTQRYSVERIDHTITPTSWSVGLGFAPVDAQVYSTGAGAFLLDSSALDGLDVLTPF